MKKVELKKTLNQENISNSIYSLEGGYLMKSYA